MDFNYSQCIKHTSAWGSDTFLNICNGVSHTLPWGSFTWTATVGTFIFLGTVFTAIVASLAAPAYFIWKEYKYD